MGFVYDRCRGNFVLPPMLLTVSQFCPRQSESEGKLRVSKRGEEERIISMDRRAVIGTLEGDIKPIRYAVTRERYLAGVARLAEDSAHTCPYNPHNLI